MQFCNNKLQYCSHCSKKNIKFSEAKLDKSTLLSKLINCLIPLSNHSAIFTESWVEIAEINAISWINVTSLKRLEKSFMDHR